MTITNPMGAGMPSGLVQRPWRAYLIIALAFVTTYLATLAAEPLVEWLRSFLWRNYKLNFWGGYPLFRYPDELMVVYFGVKYFCWYVAPFAIVVFILSSKMPTWMSLVLGFVYSTLFGLYTLMTEDAWNGYYEALTAYLAAQLCCAFGSWCCFLYRWTVSVQRPKFDDEL